MASSKRRFSRLVVAGEGNERARPSAPALPRKVEAVNGVEEEQRAHALVEVVAGAPEAVERVAFGQQLCERRRRQQSESSERSRILGLSRGDRLRSAGSSAAPPAAAPASAVGQQFQHLRQHLGAVAPVQRQRQLRDEQAVAHADIVAAAGSSSARYCSCAPVRPARRKATRPPVSRQLPPRMSMTAGVSTCMPKKQR